MTTPIRRRRRLLGTAALASTLCATVLAAPTASARTTSGAPHEPSARSTVPGTPFRDPSSRRSPATSDAMIWPVEGELTSTFGPRGGRLHRGVDIAAPTGTAVRAARDGTVSFAGWKGGYGRTLDIDHGGGQTTRLAHQSELLVTEGMRVRRGQLVGRVGTTGSSTGPHLHFELIVAGRERDPLAVLPARS